MVERLRAIALVSVCVAVAACGSEPQEPSTGEAADGVVALVGNDRLQFVPNRITADTGELTFELTCAGSAPHTLVIEETDELVVECTRGDTDTGAVELAEGTYVFFCSIPGHRAQGMEGTLTVAGP